MPAIDHDHGDPASSGDPWSAGTPRPIDASLRAGRRNPRAAAGGSLPGGKGGSGGTSRGRGRAGGIGGRGGKGRAGGIGSGKGPELLGILILSVGFLLGLSIISYSPSDYQSVQSLRLADILSFDRTPALLAKNWLGAVGAFTAHFFVFTLFGYYSIVIPLVAMKTGWLVFRRRSLLPNAKGSMVLLWSMVLTSSSAGWIYASFEPFSTAWSGTAGIALANVLSVATGTVGSAAILLILIGVTLYAVSGADSHQIIESIKAIVSDRRERIKDWSEDRALERAAKRQAVDEAKRREEEADRLANELADARADDVADHQDIDAAEEAGASAVGAPWGDDADDAPWTEDAATAQGAEARTLNDTWAEDDGSDGAPAIEIIVGEEDEKAGSRDLDRQNREKAREASTFTYRFPPKDLLDEVPVAAMVIDQDEIRRNIKTIEDKLAQHKIFVKENTTKAIVGPTVTLFELEPEDHVKISRIQSYANDLKMATASLGIRIIAPIPGKSAVGIEVPNRKRQMVYIKSLIDTRKFLQTDMDLPVAFGKTIENEVFMIDLAKLPHLLVAGATGSGKSVGVNTIITCLLYKCHPDDLKFVMIDPKKIELSLYRSIQYHYLAYLPDAEEPIVTDTSKALDTLNSVCTEMDERYELLKMALVRDIKAYNAKFKGGALEAELGHRHLPYIVVIIDELADLMITAGRQIEEPIARIAQLARAVGIHLVIATQRPSVNVITGTIKANFPARIAYQVASKVDSRTILDTGGADELVGKGDMLFSSGAGMVRVQNAFVSTEEVERITGFIGNQIGYRNPFILPKTSEEGEGGGASLDDIDDLFKDAATVVMIHRQGSVSLLQRKLKIGYNRAGRLIDQLFAAGIVGPYQGSAAREVLVESEEQLQDILIGLGL